MQNKCKQACQSRDCTAFGVTPAEGCGFWCDGKLSEQYLFEHDQEKGEMLPTVYLTVLVQKKAGLEEKVATHWAVLLARNSQTTNGLHRQTGRVTLEDSPSSYPHKQAENDCEISRICIHSLLQKGDFLEHETISRQMAIKC